MVQERYWPTYKVLILLKLGKSRGMSYRNTWNIPCTGAHKSVCSNW